MLLKEPENKTSNEKNDNIEVATQLRTTLASTYSKKFGTHFSISPTSSTNHQRLIFSKTFPSTITTVLSPTTRQKKILNVRVIFLMFFILMFLNLGIST